MRSGRRRPSRRRMKQRVTGPPRKSSGSGEKKTRRKSSSRVSSSFSPAVVPSKVSIELPEREAVSAKCTAFLLGGLGVCLLILFGGSHHSLALGMALVLPGVALLLRPPTRSLGQWMDFGILGLLVTLLFAFIPMFYWKTPAWRKVAVESFGIELPWVLSVQPMISFEAWLLAAAGFCWLYAASNWKINHAGRKRVYFWVSCVIAVFAAVVIVGNVCNWRYPGAESATAFSFFPNRNQTSNFIAIGGVVAFGYGMEGLRGRKLVHLVGLLASVLSLVALVHGVSRAGVLLYFGGILLWFLFSLRRTAVSLFFKIGFPVVLLIFSVFIVSNERTVERVTEFLSAPAEWGSEYRALLFRDTAGMIGDAPITGVGVGNFSAVFPQYRDASRSHQRAVHPESDLFWLAAEGGLVALCFLSVFVFSYLSRCRLAGAGRSGAYRMIALTGVILFLLHACVDVPGHRPGTVYFAILLAALALPHASGERAAFKPLVWRVAGGGLLLFGLLWMAGGLFGLSTHSRAALRIEEARADESRSIGDLDRASQAVNALIDWQPLNWRGYFQRAQIALSEGGARGEVAQDFRRSRFVEPNLGIITYEEGEVWLPYDVKRTISAWRETLIRDIYDKDGVYGKMLRAAHRNVALMEGMLELSKLDSNYRSRLILSLRGDAFAREIQQELEVDPSLGQFTAKQRTAIVERWISRGDLDAAEGYLQAYGDTLNSPWRMWSLVRKNQARFEEAVDFIRDAVPIPDIPEVSMDQRNLTHLRRGFLASPNDVVKGTTLLRIYLDQGELREALLVVDALLENSKPPAYAYYWRAEVLYQLKDYIESWDAFEAYLERIH